MSFQRPIWLLLIPFLILLFLWLARRRRKTPRPFFGLVLLSGFRPTPSPKRRLTFGLRELMRALPAVLVAIALAGPGFESESSKLPLLVVVDRSASMAAESAGQPRLTRTLAALRSAITEPFEMIPVPRPHFEEDASSPSAMEVADDDLLEAARFALKRGRVVLVTGREIPGMDPRIGLFAVEQDHPNAGIVAFAYGRDGSLLVRVLSTGGGEAVPWELEIWIEDVEGATRRLPLPPPSGEGRYLIKDAPMPDRGGRVRAHLSKGGGSNPVDDEAILVRSDVSPVVVVRDGVSAEIVRALEAIPDLSVIRGTGEASLTVAPEFLATAGSMLCVFCERWPDALIGDVRSVQGNLRGEGPLKDLPSDFVQFGAFREIQKLPPNSEVWLRIADLPLLVRTGPHLLLMAEPSLSDWPRRPSFPLAIARSLSAQEALEPSIPATFKAGQPCRVPAAHSVRASVRDRKGRALELLPDSSGGFLWDPDQAGIYVLERDGAGVGGVRREIAVSLLSAEATLASRSDSSAARLPKDESRGGFRSLERSVLVMATLGFLAMSLPLLLSKSSLKKSRAAPPHAGKAPARS